MRKSTDASTLITRRQAQLVKAAIKCFSRLGYHSATVKDIADEAGVSSGLIYQYVSDKHDLLSHALMHIVQRHQAEIPRALQGIDDPIAKLYCAIDAYARIIATNPHAVLLTYKETKSLRPEYINKMKMLELKTNHMIAEFIQACIRADYLSQTDVDLLVSRIIISSHAWPLKHWRLKQIVTLDEYLEQAVHASWTSLLLPRGVKQYGALCHKGILCTTSNKVIKQSPAG
ncbi:MAG: TetR/AcrR family transcriptional regulator [Alcaligenaceae bacterium]|nr:TetR/AcrR family transcriptional regulator [Alcaligenaceae bacterium]